MPSSPSRSTTSPESGADASPSAQTEELGHRADCERDLTETAAYDYALPEHLVATHPADPRPASRLLRLGEHHLYDEVFSNIERHLREGDLLVRNAVRVVPARLLGHKSTGGAVELLALEPESGGWAVSTQRFRAMARSSKTLKAGQSVHLTAPGTTGLSLTASAELVVVERRPDGTFVLALPEPMALTDFLDGWGQPPLPPYIRKRRQQLGLELIEPDDLARYQTVYAGQPGAVAAPTAGLHFTRELLQTLRDKGVGMVDVVLDVGPGTFRPVSAASLIDHPMHTERYRLEPSAATEINRALDEERRIIALGTTAFRSLEDQARRGARAAEGEYETDLFVYPGVPIRWVRGLITNFHLPRSTLLALVCAFGGYPRVMQAYRHAVEAEYRFYSYGDAMLLFRTPS